MTVADTFPNGLRPLQLVGALDILSAKRKLLADQPGAGKTAQALFAVELEGLFERRANILILCNVTGCQLTWAPELQNRVATQHDVVIADLTDPGVDRSGRPKKTMPSVAARDDRLADRLMDADETDRPLIVLANFDLMAWKFGTAPKMQTLFGMLFDAVLIDESHLVLPTKYDHPKQTTQFWSGLQRLKIRDDAIRLSMSGTPDRGKLENRYGHWKFLLPAQHTDYWAWARSSFKVSFEKVGYNPQTHRDVMQPVIGEIRQPATWEMMDRMYLIRRTKAEMLQGLPEKQWAGDGGIDLKMTRDQLDAYQGYMADLEQRYEDLLATGDEKDAKKAAGLKLQFSLRARQMATCTWDFVETEDADGSSHIHGVPRVAGPASSNKLAWIIEFLAQRGYVAGEDFDVTGGKVVIVSYFTEVLNWLRKELEAAGVASAVLTGETNAVEKKRIEAEFQRGDLRVTLLSGYLGVSINLDAADEMVFVDSVHDPDKMEQAEDRIHRASRNHQVTYWRLASIETVDMVILDVIDARYQATRATYDGARGVAFARKMLGLEKEAVAA